ncbi:MAG: heme ABC transporter ATP-binding protein [Rhodospirillaceae bacterium]|nr:heme ABC transporter ATP-binding protein [Rhodospirillaceae bacterium]|tara:strand:+ start:14045 stop:14833 length:789 start_codon:yes stop_codon:yes gene_type:complete
MLEARNISVKIGSAELLHDVSFEVSPGEVVAIVGPNGAGKSTLLKALSGLIKPVSGEVLLENKAIKNWPRLELAQRRAVLSQKIELALPFTALEVVVLGRAPYRKTYNHQENLALALDAMRQSGTEQFAERSYTSLSGGEQQRVHLARVLIQIWRQQDTARTEERYLLLDEPTSSLDLAHQHTTLEVAKRTAAEGVGVVAVLHDLNLAAMYADRIYLMKDGLIDSSGAVEDVLQGDILERVFDLPLSVSRHPTRPCLQVVAT